MGLMDEIEKRGNEKEITRLNNDLSNLLNYFESWESPDLNKIISEIEEIVKSGFYTDLIVTAKEYELSDTEIHCMGKSLKPPILKLVLDNSGVADIFKSGFSNNFNIYDILSIYKLIRVIYILNRGRELDFNDEVQVYLSGLDERIIWNLDDFDKVKVEDILDLDMEYIQSLVNIPWSDLQLESLFNKLKEFMEDLAYLCLLNADLDVSSFEYRTIQDTFIKILVPCSVINEGKSAKDFEDIIRAYNTYLKLIKADVTKYKAPKDRIKNIGVSEGYLVCESCGYVYQLHVGESPDDFVNECECGAKLKYKDENGNIIPEDIFMVIMSTLFIFAILISYYALKGFHEIWVDGQGRYFLLVLSIMIFTGFYFISKSFLRVFNWKMGVDISNDPDKEILLICRSCGNKYKFYDNLNIKDVPRKCSCGGKLGCVESEGWTDKIIDFRSLGRAKYIPVYAFSVVVLSLTFGAFNVDFASFANGEHKYVAMSLMVLLGIYMTTAVIRLSRYFGLKIRFF